jgi:hypothetical protein
MRSGASSKRAATVRERYLQPPSGQLSLAARHDHLGRGSVYRFGKTASSRARLVRVATPAMSEMGTLWQRGVCGNRSRGRGGSPRFRRRDTAGSIQLV